MRFKVISLMVGGLIGAFLLGFCLSPAEAQLTLRFGHYAEETHPGHLAAKQFCRES